MDRLSTVVLEPVVHAVLFDLDGVITDTARVHAAAWKAVFDDYLGERAERTGEEQSPFDIGRDYHAHVDGKPRVDGVEAFLRSRGIELPRGTPDDAPDAETLHGIGRRKDDRFLEAIATHGVDAFPSTVAFVEALRDEGIPRAVFSASRNCCEVLRAAGVEELFDVVVDGREAARLELPGKPEPATLLEAARRLGADPPASVVVEDATAGVAAGRRGGFGTVIGIDRGAGADALREAGAHHVVRDLAEVALELSDAWRLVYRGFDPDAERTREALCTTGNGYFATRGAAPEARADDVHAPGTYISGLFDRRTGEIDGHEVENEDLVNVPNWLPLTFRIESGDWFDPSRVELLECEQELDIRRAVLHRRLRFRDEAGRHTSVRQRRFVSMDDPHVAALETTILAEDWSGHLVVRSALDGSVENDGVARYRALPTRHLCDVETAETGRETIELRARTMSSRVEIVEGARTTATVTGATIERRPVDRVGDTIAHELGVAVEAGGAVTVTKTVAIYTSRDRAIADPVTAARDTLARLPDFDAMLEAHVLAWRQLWRRAEFRVEVSGEGTRPLMMLNLHVFHLLQTVSRHSIGRDVSMPARGLHGEAYRGHIFWDELFAFPFITMNVPEGSRSLLMYRVRRLGAAREAARGAGYDGAMYPWQSASDGREETQRMHLNPRSGRWLPDRSHRQRHVGIAIAYNLWHYVDVTGDEEFLANHGAEVLLEIARFWASIAREDPERDRYVITGVMGPDEYHDDDPATEEPGLRNNAYTNVMAAWVLERALQVVEDLPRERWAELREKLGLTTKELRLWDDVSRRLYVPFHDERIISQFEGYETLEELDWEGYRARYGDIHRLDRILEAEGDTTNRYKLSKQADVLMLFFLLTSEELGRVLGRLGYDFDPAWIPENVDYYMRRTSHGSTLSRIVHSWVLARADRPEAWPLFEEALESDLSDIQHGTTAEGVHLGAMAGTVDLLLRGFTGLSRRGNTLIVEPELPDRLASLEFSLRHRGHWGVRIRIEPDHLWISVPPSEAPPFTVVYDHARVELHAGQTWETALVTTS